MFAEAIEKVGAYTRPVQFVTLGYKAKVPVGSSATLFFVNDDGVAITCRHVAQEIIALQDVAPRYAAFQAGVDAIGDVKNRKAAIRKLEVDHDMHPGRAMSALMRFGDCFERYEEVTIHIHERYDLAILEFKGIENTRISGHAVFAPDTSFIKPGDFLCRLGFPFAEFDDYRHNEVPPFLEWDPSKPMRSPRFPIDGMVTRFLGDQQQVYGVEMSTPGLVGQSGGPLFDEDGVICGMQFETAHLHLGFDMVNHHMRLGGEDKVINNQPFLHVGHCLDVSVIKEFLERFSIRYFEADDD